MICITSLQITYAETEFEFKFGSSGSGNDNLNNPTDVILDNNGKTIYVVDSNNNRINVFDDDGDYNFKYGTFCDITTIQDCNDNADGADDDGDGQFNGPISITRDSFGKYYVADSDNDRVQIFNDYGEFQTKFGSSDSGNDDYLGTTKGVAVQDSTRDIFVSNIDNDSISVFDSTGDFLFDFDLFDGNDDFKNPTNMVIDNSEEMLYVSDSGNDRIIVFELVDGTTCPNGTVESVDGVCFVKKFGSAGSGDGKFDDPTGLAFDSTNNLLYIADTDNNRIQVFQITEEDTCPNGTKKIVDGVCFIEEFGSTGTSDGKFDSPMGIALDTTNDLLFVADSDNDRIQAFRLDIEAQATVPNKPENPEALPVSPTSIVVLWEEPELADNVPEISGYKIEYKISGENFAVIQEDTKNILTSFIHQGLDSKETYFYRIYAINSEGTSSVSSLTSTKPGHSITPVGLTATAISPNQVRLSWLPPSETFGQSISNYEIKQELGPGVYDKIGTTNGGTTAFIISDLDTDNEYTYAVSATIGFGSTGESNSASVTPRENSEYTDYSTSTSTQATVSTPPIKLTASSVSSTQNNLSWSPPSDDGDSPIKGYKVEAKEESSSFITLVEDTKSTSRSYSHKNIDADTKYTYRVSAINSVGVSEPSNQVSVSPTTTTPQISPIGKLTIDEGKLLSFTVKLSDSSIKDVSFSLKNNPPSGAKIISSSGLFSWTPSDSDGGNTYNFDVVVKEGSTTIDRETITIVVNDVKNTEPKDTEPKDTEPKDTEPKDTEPEELGIAPFVDESKDPQSYVDR
ncbi:MAG: fibronectin type III domain-containing protein, partial [Nitrosopumilaceae archaeon]|nr:fibronectin type III domain-containing protein [Nitrosopumilaceae archaeon]